MSLRLRVILAMSVIAVMVVASAFVTRQLVERQLVNQIDARLEVSSPFSFFGAGARPPDGNPGNGQTPAPGSFPSAFAISTIGTDGELQTVAVANIGGTSLPAPDVSVAAVKARAKVDRPEPFTVGAVDGSDLEYRVVVRNDPRRGVVLVVGAPLNEVADSVTTVEQIAFAIAGVVLAALALVTWWVIRLGVRPVKRMADTASRVAGADDTQAVDLSQRVEVAAAGTEIGELGRALNTMLDRVEVSFEERKQIEARLRQFVGDASHELRTPVQTIRGYTELYRLGALSEPSKLDDAMRRSEQEAVRMAALVDDLLTLARFDEHRPLRRDAVDLAVLLDDAAANARAIQPQRSITVAVSPGLVVDGDEHALRQVFANIIGNALVHTPVESSVDVTLSADGPWATIVIADRGPGMDADIADRAFERFVRADQARTRHAGGSGLGLAIVHAAVLAHDATIELDSTPETGTSVTIRLPLTGIRHPDRAA